MPISPLLPRVSVRAAHRKLPPGLVSIVDAQLASHGHGDRLDEVLDEVERVRVEAGSPPLAAPLGQIVASQALVNVLGANRYGEIVDELRDLVLGRFGQTPGPIDLALQRAVELRGAEPPPEPPDIDALRESAKGLAVERGGAAPARALRRGGRAAAPLDPAARARRRARRRAASRSERDEQIRSVVRIVQETGVGEITVEEDGVRVSVRRAAAEPRRRCSVAEPAGGRRELGAATPSATGLVTVESPMVGTFYRAPKPGRAAVRRGGRPRRRRARCCASSRR